MSSPVISIIIPTYNEEKHIGGLLAQLREQDVREPFEVIIADGRSTDGTRGVVEQWTRDWSAVKLIDNPHKFVPQALNAALQHARGRIIVRLDAHSEYPRNYLSRLTSELDRLQADNVGGVWITLPGADTAEAEAVAKATSHPLGIGNAGYRLGSNEIKKVDTVPYGCFRRDLFERIGNFDTDLLRNQDDEFNGRIVRNGGSIYLIPDVHIRYHARPTRKRMRKMFYQYGEYKPLVNIKLGAPATLRQFAPPALALLITLTPLLTLVAPLWSIPAWAMLALYVALIWSTSLQLAAEKKIPTEWRLLSMLLACAGVYFLRDVFPSKTALYAAVAFLILLPALVQLARMNNRQRRVFFNLLPTFPQIHLSYGFGYIFGWIRFVMMRNHESGNAAPPEDNR